jgi:ribosomal protein L35
METYIFRRSKKHKDHITIHSPTSEKKLLEAAKLVDGTKWYDREKLLDVHEAKKPEIEHFITK